jgi:hypothetical protein
VLELAEIEHPEAISRAQPLPGTVRPVPHRGPVVILARDGKGFRAVGELLPTKGGGPPCAGVPSLEPTATVFLFFFGEIN